MIAIKDALKTLLANVKTTNACEQVPVIEAHHRILAETQHAGVDVPPVNVSAMDGYAVTLSQVQTGTPYPISQRVAAGHPAKSLSSNSAARIFTGSEIPTSADTVVIQEDTQTKNNTVTFMELPAVGANIRRRGQDIVNGAELLHRGRRLIAQDLGLLASVGIKTIPCFRRLKIGVLSSGDELVEPGQPLTPGKIYNSNRFTLKGLINSVDMAFVDLGHVVDNLSATIEALGEAANKVDVIVTTGGVSVGEEDHIKNAVRTLGELNLWKLAIKPGKPLAYGNIQGTPFFGLPGNPVAVFVTFLMVVRPYLLKLQGDNSPTPEPISLPCDFSVDKASPRQEYRRVRINQGLVTEYHTQDSGVLSSTHWANALAVIPANTTISKGESLQVFPFNFFNL